MTQVAQKDCHKLSSQENLNSEKSFSSAIHSVKMSRFATRLL